MIVPAWYPILEPGAQCPHCRPERHAPVAVEGYRIGNVVVLVASCAFCGELERLLAEPVLVA